MNQSDLGLEIPQPFRSNHLYYGDNCWQPAKMGQCETREIRGRMGVS